LQNYARKHKYPIDTVSFNFILQAEEWTQLKNKPEDGVYIRGLFLEGARWDKDLRYLSESMPKVLFVPAPIMHWIPIRKADVPKYPHYKCPVYKTSDRRGVLATTGHSSDFAAVATF
jgi:dynein heavy chain